MIAFLLRASLKMLLLAGALYLVFFVPLGDHTLYGHLQRIGDTQEAQELAQEVGSVFERWLHKAKESFASASPSN